MNLPPVHVVGSTSYQPHDASGVPPQRNPSPGRHARVARHPDLPMSTAIAPARRAARPSVAGKAACALRAATRAHRARVGDGGGPRSNCSIGTASRGAARRSGRRPRLGAHLGRARRSAPGDDFRRARGVGAGARARLEREHALRDRRRRGFPGRRSERTAHIHARARARGPAGRRSVRAAHRGDGRAVVVARALSRRAGPTDFETANEMRIPVGRAGRAARCKSPTSSTASGCRASQASST